jgi:ElaB/YqjD/DUF883 family membrane-anchored ribosome-binding protein
MQGDPTMATATPYSNETARSTSDRASDFADNANQQIDRALDRAENVARQVADQGREATERVGEVAGNIKVAVDKSVKDQPMATLAVAAAVGFVMGALWKS